RSVPHWVDNTLSRCDHDHNVCRVARSCGMIIVAVAIWLRTVEHWGSVGECGGYTHWGFLPCHCRRRCRPARQESTRTDETNSTAARSGCHCRGTRGCAGYGERGRRDHRGPGERPGQLLDSCSVEPDGRIQEPTG